MRPSHFLRLALLAGGLLTGSTAAAASVITYELSGTVDHVGPQLPVGEPTITSVSIDDPFAATITLDYSVAERQPGFVVAFSMAVGSYSVDGVGGSWSFESLAQATIVLAEVPPAAPSLDGLAPLLLVPLVWDGPDPPTPQNILDKVSDSEAAFTFLFLDELVLGYIQSASIVPEPGARVLQLAAVLVLGILSRLLRVEVR